MTLNCLLNYISFMKHIIKLRPHHYLQVDSYKRQRHNKKSDMLFNALTILVFICLSAITLGAALGIDITNPNPNSNANTR